MKKLVITIIIILLCITGAGVGLYFNMDAHGAFDSASFPKHTSINGVDCSELTVSQAAKELTEEWNSRDFRFLEDEKTIGSIKTDSLTYAVTEPLKEIRRNHFIKTALNYYLNQPLDLTMEMIIDEGSDTIRKDLKDAEFLKADSITVTEDAYINLSSADLEIVPEVYGNNIDYTLLSDEVCSLIQQGEFQMDYESEAYCEQPSITADNEDLLKRQEVYQQYIVSNVTYILGKDTVKIAPEDLADIYGVELASSGAISDETISALEKAFSADNINEDAVYAYAQKFASKYNTFGDTRKFTSLSGNEIEVSGGNYGFALDVNGEAEQLLEDLKSGETIKREPIWLMTGYVEYDMENDIGDTYVEISIEKQHLWFFKDGKKVVDCDVVTGNPYMGYSTPTGTFALSYKQRGSTLRGQNADGSDYESDVSYWMPFYGNYGMHDASWRSSFGGKIYLGGGSHGCVNMPIPAAKEVFENIDDRKVPIIVY